MNGLTLRVSVACQASGRFGLRAMSGVASLSVAERLSLSCPGGMETGLVSCAPWRAIGLAWIPGVVEG